MSIDMCWHIVGLTMRTNLSHFSLRFSIKEIDNDTD